MALERRNGRTYCYVPERSGRAARRRYLGAGLAAVSAAHLIQAERERQEGEKLDRDGRAEARGRGLVRLRGWLAGVEAAVAAAQAAAGWHRHYGEWRRKREGTMTAMAPASLPWHGPDLARAAGALGPEAAKQAAEGDRAATAAVDAFLDKPAAVALWGDLGRRLLQRWVAKYAGKCLTTERAVLRFAADLRDRLAGPNPDALARLVAERVVICWVTRNYFEHHYVAVAGKKLLL